jgi:hypothetical protein
MENIRGRTSTETLFQTAFQNNLKIRGAPLWIHASIMLVSVVEKP